jgi:hypothetical protein
VGDTVGEVGDTVVGEVVGVHVWPVSVGVRVVSVGQSVPKAVNQPRFVFNSRWVGEDGRNAQHRRDPR